MRKIGTRCAFTLIEVLMALAIGGFALVGMFAIILSYVNIWQVSSNQSVDESFNRESIIRNFFQEQLSGALSGSSIASNGHIEKALWFCDDDGKNDSVDRSTRLYWLSHDRLPFVPEVKKDAKVKYIKYWLLFKGTHNALSGDDNPGELYIAYKVFTDRSDEDITGEKLITKHCRGVNFGYIQENSTKLEYLSKPKIKGVASIVLPDVVQILLDEDKEILKALK